MEMKYLLTLIISLSFAKTSLSQSTPAKQEPQKQITITMPKIAWDIVVEGLSKLTGRDAHDVWNYIDNQVYIQQQIPAIKPKNDSTEIKKPPVKGG